MEFFRGFDKRKELFNCFVKPWSSIERGGLQFFNANIAGC
jgi:hypothetical protein